MKIIWLQAGFLFGASMFTATLDSLQRLQAQLRYLNLKRLFTYVSSALSNTLNSNTAARACLVCLVLTAPVHANTLDGVQVAFMPDIHFHDVYGELEGSAFKGIPTGAMGHHALIRTMQAQLTSTRLFNENYFVLIAALDEIVKRKITYVALPGDFSDDGQPVHIRGLTRLLNYYHTTHGLQFFATPGNHDPVRPFDTPGGKPDFMAADGTPIAIYSPDSERCQSKQNNTVATTGKSLVCTPDIRQWGYENILREMASFGFTPSKKNLFWTTPFASYTPEGYTFTRALSAARLSKRRVDICQQMTADKKALCEKMLDASYLVEPVEGLWLLAIDANVYLPQARIDPTGKRVFSGSGNAGYNAVRKHKPYLEKWIKAVVGEANKRGKTLIAFSHFPMIEFYDGQSNTIADIFGNANFQLARKPEIPTSDWLADLGLKIHIGGHMHMNDTGIITSSAGNTLVNIQAPSLAAYVPAFKLVTLRGQKSVEVETVVVDQVPRFRELFEHYRTEHKALEATPSGTLNAPIWNEAILAAKTYREFTEWHLRELVRLRFLPGEWPADLRETLRTFTGEELLTLAFWQANEKFSAPSGFAKSDPQWASAQTRCQQWLKKNALNSHNLREWRGQNLAEDFYRLRNAGSLALADIPSQNLADYQLLLKAYRSQVSPTPLQQRLKNVLAVLSGFQQGAPDNHFKLNLTTGKIDKLSD
ncbi:metallophosphoesterase family protein [Teredinibacter turnerae]|uniref:metallophosphoesterase family protein n=1 Tax=Teredinibacter turnerae TaxID=2426 RepID=UPI000AB221B9|nr:metallophosphoesterase [Teredinibacter turnerae]